jgi:hypothetical protein
MLYSPKSLPLALALSVVASLSLICLAVFGYDSPTAASKIKEALVQPGAVNIAKLPGY